MKRSKRSKSDQNKIENKCKNWIKSVWNQFCQQFLAAENCHRVQCGLIWHTTQNRGNVPIAPVCCCRHCCCCCRCCSYYYYMYYHYFYAAFEKIAILYREDSEQSLCQFPPFFLKSATTTAAITTTQQVTDTSKYYCCYIVKNSRSSFRNKTDKEAQIHKK